MKQSTIRGTAASKVAVARTAKKKPLTKFAPQVRSRHHTHDAIRGKLGLFGKRCIIRFGSVTPTEVAFPAHFETKPIVEINPVVGVQNSSNKLLMKQRFDEAGVKTASWAKGADIDTIINNLNNHAPKGNAFPVVSKHIFGSRGTGNKLHNTPEELRAWAAGKDLSRYIFEAYFSGVREYRLHISKNGCFYTCRKMLKEGTPDNDRWRRHDDNSVWIMDDKPKFDKPSNWDAIVAECVKALNAVGLDVAAFDIRVQSTKNGKGVVRENPDFIILESNSAPSFGTVTTQKYLVELPKLIAEKVG